MVALAFNNPAQVDESGDSTQIASSRLTEPKIAQLNADIAEAVEAALAKNGLVLTRLLFTVENSLEISSVIRASVIDANGLDAMHRDLLNYCTELRFKANILNASLIVAGGEYQVSGLDLSTRDHKFRLTNLSKEHKYMPIADVKQLLPNFFY